MPMAYTMKFMDMVWAAFFARVKPVSTIAKPACMNITRKPVSSVQTMLIAILLWPTTAITSGSVGFLASLTGTSAAVPVFSPVGSGTGAAAAAAAGAGVSAGAAADGAGLAADSGTWAWIARSTETPSISAAP